VNSDRIGVQLPFLICDPNRARIHEELPPQSLFLTCRNCQKTCYQIMYFDHIGSHDELLHLAEVVPNLSIFVRRYPYIQFKRLFSQRKHKYCEKKAVDTEREEQNKKNLQVL